MLIEIWSDVVCPWCYIGKRRFEAALSRFPRASEVRVRWRSFELDPSAPRVRDRALADHLAGKYGVERAEAEAMQARMTALAAEEGLDYRLDRARLGNTFDAHRLLQLAAEYDVQGQFKERLMAAAFTEGEPVGEPATLRRLAAQVGLDNAEVDEVLAGDAYADAVRTDEADARALGITGVPCFTVDRSVGVSGAQPPDVLRRLLEQGRQVAEGLRG